MDLAASLLTKGQCDAVSHQQRRVPSFTLHVEFDKSCSSVVYRNAPRYTSLSCGYTLPEINWFVTEFFDCSNSKCCCTSSCLILNKKWRPCDTRDTRNEAAIATLPYFALYQSARTREDWETVIDKDCAVSIGGLCGRISQKEKFLVSCRWEKAINPAFKWW